VVEGGLGDRQRFALSAVGTIFDLAVHAFLHLCLRSSWRADVAALLEVNTLIH
jgi:hypothetical protein